jgi:hypothetical protein
MRQNIEVRTEPASARHQCMIYDGAPSRVLHELATSLRQNLDAGRRCMYLNSPAMVAGVRSRLYAAGIDAEREIMRGALVLVSDDDHLVDGHFVVDRMIDLLDAAVDGALTDGYAGLFATGDMSWEFGPENDFAKLLEYEWRLEQLFHERPQLSGICQYHRDLLPREAICEGVVSHGSVFVSATLTRLNPHYVQASSPAERQPAAVPELDVAVEDLLAAKR